MKPGGERGEAWRGRVWARGYDTCSPMYLLFNPMKLEYYKSQETSTMYYKQLKKLKQKLDSREIKIHALNQEIAKLKEKLSSL